LPPARWVSSFKSYSCCMERSLTQHVFLWLWYVDTSSTRSPTHACMHPHTTHTHTHHIHRFRSHAHTHTHTHIHTLQAILYYLVVEITPSGLLLFILRRAPKDARKCGYACVRACVRACVCVLCVCLRESHLIAELRVFTHHPLTHRAPTHATHLPTRPKLVRSDRRSHSLGPQSFQG